MEASDIIEKLNSAFSSISKRDNIAINEIKIAAWIKPVNATENSLELDLYSGSEKIRSVDISTEILGLQKTKAQLAAMYDVGRKMFDLHGDTQKLEGMLGMGIFMKCSALNFDVSNSKFVVSKPGDEFIAQLVCGDKIKEFTMKEVFSMEGMFGQ